MRFHFLICTVVLLLINKGFAQNTIDLKGKFDVEKHQIKIEQTIEYQNTTTTTLHDIYLTDWSHSFATKQSPLAIRLSDEFKNAFQFAKNEDRGFTAITSMDQDGKAVTFERLKDHIDVIKVMLNTPIGPTETYTLKLTYTVQFPSDRFTRYGVSNNGDFNLRYWYITPAIYDGEWRYFSHMNLDDMYVPNSKIRLELEFPKNYIATSELNETSKTELESSSVIVLEGNDRINSKLFLNQQRTFNTIETDYLTLLSNIDNENLGLIDEALVTDKVLEFVTNNFGLYPHKKLIISHIDYKKSPIYGLNLLPDFIRPFPDSFQYELKLLKTVLHNYLENTMYMNPRKDQWLIDGIQTYYLIKYVEENYPDMKIFGTLSNIWGIKSFHAAQLKFNDQYGFLYMDMVKRHIEQPLNTSKDSLLKFNKNIANKYKAGVGLRYLDDYDENFKMESLITEFVSKYKLKQASTATFEALVRSKSPKNNDWFFKDYLKETYKVDYKITDVKKTQDSLQVTIKNRREGKMPIALFQFDKDSIISKTWIDGIADKQTVTIPNKQGTKLVLNHDRTVPEYNNRNNTKSLTNSWFNKPFQLRLIKDVEDPRYNQVFIMPIVEYDNIYDGLVLGAKAYNKTVLKKPFTYKLAPQFATKSNALTGSANLIYHQYTDQLDNLFKIQYVLTGSYSSYAEGLFVTSFKPNISFHFRDKNNLRSNKRQYLIF